MVNAYANRLDSSKGYIRWWHGADYQKHISGEKTPQRKNVKLGSCGLYPFGISRLSQ